MKAKLEFWKNINASELILDVIENGYKIPFYSCPEKTYNRNNKSALLEDKCVAQAIKDLLDRNLVEKCSEVPLVVNPLTVSVQSSGKKRLILDLRCVNKHLW